MVGGGASKTPSSTTTVNKTEPPAYLQPYLTDLAKQAQTAYQQVSKDPYTGQLIAAPTAAQNQANSLALGIANNNLNLGDSYRGAADTAKNMLNSGYLRSVNDMEFTPTDANTSGAIAAALAPLRDSFQNEILPGISSAAIDQGAYGGSRMGQVQEKALRDFDTTAQNTAATIAQQEVARKDALSQADLADRRTNISKTGLLEQNLLSLYPQLATSAYGADLTPATTMQQVGASQQLANQDTLDAQYAQYLMNQAAPFQGLDEYASLIYGQPGGSTSTSTATPKAAAGSGGFGSILSGGLGGAGLGLALGLSTPWTAGLAGGGALLSALFS